MMYIDHRYEVLESLGTGSWANVYKVRDVRTDNTYTLKLFQYLSSEDLYKQFRAADMHHITKIVHPNLTRVVDFGHVGDHIYFVGEYFDGATLNNFRFSKARARDLYDIIVQICYALNALHTQNIMHKDLKPENILYKKTLNGIEVKLIDYGFSRLELDQDTQYVSGTLPYIAPEIYTGKGAGYASDFYSLGVIIYRLLTGSFPFTLDQINAMRSSSRQYFSPVYPVDLNPNIPLPLQNLCIELLDRNPDSRPHQSEEIIKYINRTTDRQYKFAVSWSLVNSMQFNSYLVQERIVNDLLAYLPQVEAANGKIISLIAGEGMGKDNILSLFRYHILRGGYFIFDYTCTRNEHEAFFALIKEYLRSLSEQEIAANSALQSISEKMRRYLFMSEQAAMGVTPSEEDLRADFEFAKALLTELAETKPVIFIVRNIQHLHRHSLEFLNFFSNTVVTNRIMIVMSCTDFNQLRQIKNTVLINVPMFTPEESAAYIRKLVNGDVPDGFCQLIHHRSAGNPFLIREIMINLTLLGKIRFDGAYRFPDGLDDYTIPTRLLQSVISRVEHLSLASRKQLQKLAIVQTPISRELIRYICKVKDEEIYDLLNEAKYNEILLKRENHYHFTFAEAKTYLYDRCQPRMRDLVSRRVLKYYNRQNVTDPQTCTGIISNARIARDLVSERRYLLQLHLLHCEEHRQQEAYDAMAEVLRIDLGGELELPLEELVDDLGKFHRMIEFTGCTTEAEFVFAHQAAIPECFEKYSVLGTLILFQGDRKSALKNFEKAEKLSAGACQKSMAKLYQAQIYARTDPARVKKCLDGIALDEVSQAFQIKAATLMAAYAGRDRDFDGAARGLEQFLAELVPSQDPDAMIELASLHNTLGEIYSIQKNVAEADEHFNTALNIWNSFNIRRHLGWIHNNLADLNLKQGFTILGLNHAQQAQIFAKDRQNLLSEGRALLNQGEAMIKMGRFEEAEAKLLDARELITRIGADRYLVSIERNLALAKSKISDFGHYFKFISEHEPKLIDGIVPEINPLVKTYFYYLSEMSNPKKLRRLIRKNAHIDYIQIQEQEFYHNILSLLAMMEQDFATALNELKLALQFAGEINNHYAMAVFNVLQATCHYGLGDTSRAADLIAKARPAIQENQYRYWERSLDLLELKLRLADPAIPLREVLREINRQLELCRGLKYYHLVEELQQLKIQLLVELGSLSTAEEEFAAYRKYLETITKDISADDRDNYLEVKQHGLQDIAKYKVVPIASRRKDTRSRWNDMLFDISNVNSLQRVKFLIEKGISQIIAPWQFMLLVWSEKLGSYYNFHSYNADPEAILPPAFLPCIEKAIQTDNLVTFAHEEKHIAILPLLSGSKVIGYLVLSDAGELEFTPGEQALLKNVKSHLAAMLVRTWDYQEINLRMEKMNRLIEISHELMGLLDLSELETALVSAAIDLTGATRGFLIKKDTDGNNIFQVQLDQNGQILSTAFGVSKTALNLCQGRQKTVSVYNAKLDKSFEDSVSVHDYAIQTIFCSPLKLAEDYTGYIYLDNVGDSTRDMYLNEDIMLLLMNLFANAVKNVLQYSSLMRKSAELNNLEQLKDEFIGIVTHELNTPIFMMQGALTKLKRSANLDDKQRRQIFSELEAALNKLNLTSSDIQTMNHYNLAKKLDKSPLQVSDVLELIHQQVEILSRERRMHIRLEIESGLPPLQSNWTDLHRMVYNIVLNAVRFTREAGLITIGARRSAFVQEKIDNKESLVIFVTDNGMGMPKHLINEVFRKFYELNAIYAHKSGIVEYRSSGLGLGLSIARRIAELHGGQIVIKSKENEGTSVFIILPFK
ncbi:MAG: protein kinase [Candidatus Cloacimonetes bacterium]|nr:protein kinase [Candidatus Cloacimonadota bacterium]MDY0366944.1 protein kinase [Candidatus Syntrophosphaera sp.]